MAGEVSHIVYGKRLHAYLGEAVSTPSFWAGTLFPDIRHLGIISRHTTHPDDVTLQTLPGENDFITGLRVHSWIDSTRSSFLRDQRIKEVLPWHPFIPHALKLYEDEILYDKFDDWNLIQRVLNEVDEQALQYVGDRQVILKWHGILQDYFATKPNNESRAKLATSIGLSTNSAAEINSLISRLSEIETPEKLVDDFKQKLEVMLK